MREREWASTWPDGFHFVLTGDAIAATCVSVCSSWLMLCYDMCYLSSLAKKRDGNWQKHSTINQTNNPVAHSSSFSQTHIKLYDWANSFYLCPVKFPAFHFLTDSQNILHILHTATCLNQWEFHSGWDTTEIETKQLTNHKEVDWRDLIYYLSV